MRVFPSVVIGCILVCASALTPAQASNSKNVPVNTSGATIVLGGSSAKIYISGQKSKTYKGGPIPGISTATIYTEGNKNVLTDLGTVTADFGATLSLTITKAGSNSTVLLNSGTSFTAGGTLSLGTGSTVSLGGTLSDTNGITINSGAVFTAASTSTINAGVTFTGITNASLTSRGTLLLNSANMLTSGATLTLGTNSTINGGLLTFGTDGAIDAGGLIKAGAGSTILSANNFTLNTGTITNVPITGGLIISGPTGTLTGGTLTLGATISGYGGTLGGSGVTVTLRGPTDLSGGVISLGGTNTLNLAGTNNLNLIAGTLTSGANGTGNIVLSGPATMTISSTSAVLNRTVSIPLSTKLTVNMAPGTPLKLVPPVQLATTDASATSTKTSFLDGLVTNGGSVSILYLPAVQTLFSSPVSINLSELETPGVQEKFVLQMSYDAVAASSLGNLLNLYLAWFDPADSTWKNAVDENSDGGAGAHLMAGAYDPTIDFNLGSYGVDTTNSTVWAVVDHDGEFGVGGLATVTHTTLAIHSTVPEPSTAALLVCGLALLGRRSRQR